MTLWLFGVSYTSRGGAGSTGGAGGAGGAAQLAPDSSRWLQIAPDGSR